MPPMEESDRISPSMEMWLPTAHQPHTRPPRRPQPPSPRPQGRKPHHVWKRQLAIRNDLQRNGFACLVSVLLVASRQQVCARVRDY